MLPFICQVLFVHVLLFGIFYYYMFNGIDSTKIILLRFGEFMISAIPGFLQVEENLYKSIFLLRFNNNGIIGTDCEKTI